jgi:hypothetical protein
VPVPLPTDDEVASSHPSPPSPADRERRRRHSRTRAASPTSARPDRALFAMTGHDVDVDAFVPMTRRLAEVRRRNAQLPHPGLQVMLLCARASSLPPDVIARVEAAAQRRSSTARWWGRTASRRGSSACRSTSSATGTPRTGHPPMRPCTPRPDRDGLGRRAATRCGAGSARRPPRQLLLGKGVWQLYGHGGSSSGASRVGTTTARAARLSACSPTTAPAWRTSRVFAFIAGQRRHACLLPPGDNWCRCSRPATSARAGCSSRPRHLSVGARWPWVADAMPGALPRRGDGVRQHRLPRIDWFEIADLTVDEHVPTSA